MSPRVCKTYRSGASLLLLAATLACACPSAAESLSDAMQQSLASNAGRGAQQAGVRAAQAGISVAESGYRPVLSAESQFGWLQENTRSNSYPYKLDRFSHPRELGLQLDQNIWNGFKTTSTVQRETETARSAGEQLRTFDQNLLLDVVTAYTDVLRNQAALELYRTDSRIQAARSAETAARVKNGLATMTDVDQETANLGKSRANELVAQSNLETARARYRLLVGHDPAGLALPGIPEQLVPASRDAALALARQNHPSISAASYTAAASAANVKAEQAGYLPSLDLQVSALRDFDPQSSQTTTNATTVGALLKLTVPLYQGGLTTASVQKARELAQQDLLNLDYQRQTVDQTVVAAWGQYQTSRDLLKAAKAQIVAANRALAGILAGAKAGERGVLEVNDAQATAVDAKVSLSNAQCNLVVAAYQLIAATGRLVPSVAGAAGAGAMPAAGLAAIPTGAISPGAALNRPPRARGQVPAKAVLAGDMALRGVSVPAAPALVAVLRTGTEGDPVVTGSVLPETGGLRLDPVAAMPRQPARTVAEPAIALRFSSPDYALKP